MPRIPWDPADKRNVQMVVMSENYHLDKYHAAVSPTCALHAFKNMSQVLLCGYRYVQECAAEIPPANHSFGRTELRALGTNL